MVGQDRSGRAVRVEARKGRLPPRYFLGWSTAEVRGFLARLLVNDGASHDEAMGILRLSRSTFYQVLRTPPPAHARGIDEGRPIRFEG